MFIIQYSIFNANKNYAVQYLKLRGIQCSLGRLFLFRLLHGVEDTRVDVLASGDDTEVLTKGPA